MSDRIHPLLVPAEDSRPHLICLVRLNLLLEEARHASQGNQQPLLSLMPAALLVPLYPRGTEQRDQVRSRYIEIGEIGAVGFMDIEVTLQYWGAGGGDYREEERERLG